jgi:hypothetical protein
LRKKPYSSVLTAASTVASQELKINACAFDLTCCCVLLPEIQLLLKKKLLRKICVVARSRVLVICSNTGVEQERGHTFV